MSKSYKSKNGKPYKSFIMIDRYVFKTDAWASLTAADKSVYLILLIRYVGNNNGRIPLSVREAAFEANIAKGTASKAFKNLVEKGFIKNHFSGSFSQKRRLASEWELTHLRYNNELPSKEFTSYKKIPKKMVIPRSTSIQCKLENHNVV